MTWCFGFNYETGGKRTKKKKKRRRGGRRKTVVKFGLCDESAPPSKTRILMSVFSAKWRPILLHWNLTKKSSLLPFVSIWFLIAVVLFFFVVYVGPTVRSFINHWTNLHSPLFSSPSFHLTLSLSIILGLKNRPMFLTEPCPLNLISKTEIEGGGCPSVSPLQTITIVCYLQGLALCLVFPGYKNDLFDRVDWPRVELMYRG